MLILAPLNRTLTLPTIIRRFDTVPGPKSCRTRTSGPTWTATWWRTRRWPSSSSSGCHGRSRNLTRMEDAAIAGAAAAADDDGTAASCPWSVAAGWTSRRQRTLATSRRAAPPSPPRTLCHHCYARTTLAAFPARRVRHPWHHDTPKHRSPLPSRTVCQSPVAAAAARVHRTCATSDQRQSSAAGSETTSERWRTRDALGGTDWLELATRRRRGTERCAFVCAACARAYRSARRRRCSSRRTRTVWPRRTACTVIDPTATTIYCRTRSIIINCCRSSRRRRGGCSRGCRLHIGWPLSYLQGRDGQSAARCWSKI